MGKRIDNLDLTKRIDPWDFPHFPISLRLKLYGRMNPAHASIYAGIYLSLRTFQEYFRKRNGV